MGGYPGAGGYPGMPGGKSGGYPGMPGVSISSNQISVEVQRLVAEHGMTTDENRRAGMRTNIQKLLERQFDFQQQQRQNELAQIEQQVQRVRGLLAKRNEQRSTIVGNRLEQLLRDADGLGWQAPSPAITLPPATSGDPLSAPGGF